MRVEAPTLEYSEKDPKNVDIFYELKSVIKKVKSTDSLVKAGDSNIETGTAALESNMLFRKQLGIYGKGRPNSLLELVKSQSFKLTNTFFKHKKCHRPKWEWPIKISL